MSILKNPVSDQDHVQGIKTAPLELVEYGDYQCPSCGESYLILKQVQQCLGKKLKYVFRNFPLTEHQDAFGAAMAAEAAALQGKFWEMYDMLYSNQRFLSSDDFLTYADAIQLDAKKFEKDCDSNLLRAKIEADIEGGERSGVTGTPNFYINGKKYDGDWGYDELMHHLKEVR